MNPSDTPPGLNDALEINNVAGMRGHGSVLTAAVSGLALIGSVVSLWHSTLKQPQIEFYVSENIQYTRDPYGSYDVLAVPLTIVNDGARDGAVLSLELEVKNATTGKAETFKSAYSADAQFFGSREDVATRIKRPKVPFAPLSVAGRSAYTGTILFYRAEGGEKSMIDPQSKLELTLSLVVPPPGNGLDRMLTRLPQPLSFKADVPNYLPGALLSGDNAPLKVSF